MTVATSIAYRFARLVGPVRQLAAASAILLVAGCGVGAGAPPVEETLRERVEQLRSGALSELAGEAIDARDLVAAVYEGRAFRPAWVTPRRRAALVQIVEGIDAHGLDPRDYRLEALRSDRDDIDPTARELLFTDTLIRLVTHLRAGKLDPRALYPEWNFPGSNGPSATAAAIDALLEADALAEAVEAHAPQLDEYRRLRVGLAAHRKIAAAGGWPAVEPGRKLRAGDRDARVASLRARLAASGDLAPAPLAQPESFDATLAAAVARFQSRHGLEPDGVAGRRTIDALNVDVGRRIGQIRVNLERLRWVAQDIRGSYLLVDIAGFNARLYLDDALVWSSRVVVGKPFRETPAFQARMQYLVLNPDWVVPPTILREDLIGKLAADPAHLVEAGMRVVDDAGNEIPPESLDWAAYRAGGFPYQVVQPPGPDNPLGQVKFMLPNPHAVYLHDTPAKALFRRTDRAFSSGCIRLERPLELAVLLLDDPLRWTAEALAAEIATGQTKTLPVRHKVPVLVLYHTAEAGDDGVVSFHGDLYGRDAAVAAGLAHPRGRVAVAAGAHR